MNNKYINKIILEYERTKYKAVVRKAAASKIMRAIGMYKQAYMHTTGHRVHHFGSRAEERGAVYQGVADFAMALCCSA
jgi:hypothetical protein